MILSAYLTYTAWAEKLVAFCVEGSGCDVVLNSRWSMLLGMPTSFWGFLTYGLLAAVAWNRYADNQWRWRGGASIVEQRQLAASARSKILSSQFEQSDAYRNIEAKLIKR